MDITDSTKTTNRIISSESLPAILIGGPPHAGKSVLTYNLTKRLRELDIPHYVFRASPDGEGDWSFEGDFETVYEFIKKSKHRWSDIFRNNVCNDLSHRQFPLIVDLGGCPTDKDTCIFQTCQYAILIFRRDASEKDLQTWYSYIDKNKLELIKEIRSQEPGESAPSLHGLGSAGPTISLKPGNLIYHMDFGELVEQIKQIFSPYTLEQLKQWHLFGMPTESVVNLPERFTILFRENDENKWEPRMLKKLLADLPVEQTAFYVYGRGPAWVYGAISLHGGTRPFHQFDARLGWVTPPSLQAVASVKQATSSTLPIEGPYVSDDTFAIALYPTYNYLDMREADKLKFPEPQPRRGVIVSGKLPLWLFTALARFYAKWDVPWIALNDARDNKAIVIYSQVATHPLGKRLPMPQIV
jgi:CRISPR-associated protein Csx3